MHWLGPVEKKTLQMLNITVLGYQFESFAKNHSIILPKLQEKCGIDVC